LPRPSLPPYNRLTLVDEFLRQVPGTNWHGEACFVEVIKNPVMRKRLQLVLMVSTLAATFLSLIPPVHAAHGEQASDNIATADDHGRKIYVNDFVTASQARPAEVQESPRRKLMYWSSKDNRWKPVPSANTASMRAARSAAAEVSQFIGKESKPLVDARIMAANSGNVASSPMDVDAAIEQAAARHNVDPNLVRAVVKVESNFNPNAISRKGAMGLMQLMPSTARELNVKNPFDPEQNVDAGVRHLKQLLENYRGDIKLTLAAYNAGARAVARSSGVPHFAETQSYVRRITNLYYGGVSFDTGAAPHNPVTIQRDARGVLYISNTE
jgi:hypothetical protein